MLLIIFLPFIIGLAFLSAWGFKYLFNVCIWVFNYARKNITISASSKLKAQIFWSIFTATVCIQLWLLFAPEPFTDDDYEFATGMTMPESAKVIESRKGSLMETADIHGHYGASGIIQLHLDDMQNLEKHLQNDSNFEVKITKSAWGKHDTTIVMIISAEATALTASPSQAELSRATEVTYSSFVDHDDRTITIDRKTGIVYIFFFDQ